MNCLHCNAPLEPAARFCRNCGAPSDIVNPANNPAFAQGDPPTVISQPSSQPAQPPPWQQPPQPAAPAFSSPPPAQYQPAGAAPGTFQNAPVRTLSATDSPPAPLQRRRRRRGGFFGGCLIVLVILVILAAASWVFGVRPYLNSLAKSEINQALSGAVQQIDPTKTSQLPPGPISVNEDTLNNLVTLAHSPSSPMQNAKVTVTDTIRLDFTLYGFQCAVTAVPQTINGQLSMTNVQIDGIISWILSSDDVTQIVNSNLADAQQRLKHPILSVSLANHDVNLVVGPSLGS